MQRGKQLAPGIVVNHRKVVTKRSGRKILARIEAPRPAEGLRDMMPRWKTGSGPEGALK
jgi:hypothetical protein